MQREIKFRAWDTLIKAIMSWDEMVETPLLLPAVLSNKDFVVMQYTGLKDKNGKEIYEGDVVQWNLGGGPELDMALVKWNDGTQGWTPFINSTSKIIGNIYENSDLLK